MKIKVPFSSKEQAEAYADGLEYVNEPSISEVEIHRTEDGWSVIFEDSDVGEP